MQWVVGGLRSLLEKIKNGSGVAGGDFATEGLTGNNNRADCSFGKFVLAKTESGAFRQ